jgi:hypothetical protein
MNREEAAAEVDQLLNLWNSQAVDGRCPRCEALLELKDVEPDEVSPRIRETLNAGDEPAGYGEMWMHHAEDCTVRDALAEAVIGARPWGFEFRRERAVRTVDGKPTVYTVLKRVPD